MASESCGNFSWNFQIKRIVFSNHLIYPERVKNFQLSLDRESNTSLQQSTTPQSFSKEKANTMYKMHEYKISNITFKVIIMQKFKSSTVQTINIWILTRKTIFPFLNPSLFLSETVVVPFEKHPNENTLFECETLTRDLFNFIQWITELNYNRWAAIICTVRSFHIPPPLQSSSLPLSHVSSYTHPNRQRHFITI